MTIQSISFSCSKCNQTQDYEINFSKKKQTLTADCGYKLYVYGNGSYASSYVFSNDSNCKFTKENSLSKQRTN
jgi:hypothetical protein